MSGEHDDLLRRLLPPLSMARKGGALAVELGIYGARLDAADLAAAALLTESDPRSTSDLLADWERVYGLEAGSDSDAVRRAALLAQILSGGGQSCAFYEQLAAAVGYTATVTEFALHTVMSAVDYPLYGAAWRFGWRVTAHAEAEAVTTVAVEALLRRLAPAHTFVQFTYI